MTTTQQPLTETLHTSDGTECDSPGDGMDAVCDHGFRIHEEYTV